MKRVAQGIDSLKGFQKILGKAQVSHRADRLAVAHLEKTVASQARHPRFLGIKATIHVVKPMDVQSMLETIQQVAFVGTRAHHHRAGSRSIDRKALINGPVSSGCTACSSSGVEIVHHVSRKPIADEVHPSAGNPFVVEAYRTNVGLRPGRTCSQEAQ